MQEQQHPIEGLMKTAMESIKQMVDVNTILGDPVETSDGTTIIPISKVAFGFAAGGSEYDAEAEGRSKGKEAKSGGNGNSSGNGSGQQASADSASGKLPFGGGSGAGISLQPVAFLVVGGGTVRLMPVDGGALWNRLIDIAPDIIDQVKNAFKDGNNEQSRSYMEPAH